MSVRAGCGSALVLALFLTGCERAQRTPDVAPAEAWFEERAVASGLVFRHESGHRERFWMPEIMGGGAALLDMDDDGDLDAYLVQSGSLDGHLERPNRLFRNGGQGRFLDVTEGSGADDTRYGNGVACGDVDDDGDTDVYVTNTGRNTLLVNQGGGQFLDATDVAGVGDPGWGTSAAFLDADADGRLDLFVTNYLDWSLETDIECLDPLARPDYCGPKNYTTPARDLFYRNLGSGRFADESQESGVSASPGTGMGVACADFDADGHMDVFVANDGMPNRLWLGRGDCTFVDRAMEWGCATDADGIKKAGMGVVLGDVDDDLDEDLLVCNLAGESDSLYLNGGAYFVDSTARRGLANVSKAFTRFGMGLVDFDADGRLDLYVANGRVQSKRTEVEGDPYAEENLLFRGTASGRFEEVLPRGGTAVPLVATSRAAAFGDVNGDGAVDILVVDRDEQARLLLNRRESRNHAVHFRVRERCGRDALGASLTLEVAGRKLRRSVRAAYSYQASNDPRVHVGLAGGSRIEHVEVRWADGALEAFGPFELPPGESTAVFEIQRKP